MTVDATIRAVQTKLGVTPDGQPGPQTWNAIHRALVGEAPTPTGTTKLADERSERNIATLLPEVQQLARALVESAATIGIGIKIISGTRSYDEQNSLYEQGRSKPGRIVTTRAAATPTTTLESRSILACSKAVAISTNLRPTRRSAHSA